MNVEDLLSKMTLEEKVGQLLQCGTSIYKDYEEIQWEMLRKGKIGAFLYIKPRLFTIVPQKWQKVA